MEFQIFLKISSSINIPLTIFLVLLQAEILSLLFKKKNKPNPPKKNQQKTQQKPPTNPKNPLQSLEYLFSMNFTLLEMQKAC